jgi:hypothetical protein
LVIWWIRLAGGCSPARDVGSRRTSWRAARIKIAFDGARALVEHGEAEYEVLRDEWSRGG